MTLFWIWLVPLVFFTVLTACTGNQGCKNLEYLKCIQNKTMTDHVIKTIKVLAPGLAICQNKCFQEIDCTSYNLGPVESNTRMCELNEYDHLSSPKFISLTDKQGYEHCPIKNPCSSSPCPNQRFCKPSKNWDTFICRVGSWTPWGAWPVVDQCPCTPPTRTRVCRNPNTGRKIDDVDCSGSNQDTKPCGPVKPSSIEGCNHAPLGLGDGTIPDDRITAYSTGGYCKTSQARLNGPGGWCSAGNLLGLPENVQVDLCSEKIVTKVATQSKYNKDNWLKEYSLYFSQDGVAWNQYNGSTSGKMIFNGNTDINSIVTNTLPVPIKARYIRVVPELNRGWTAMRFELYGC